MYDHAILALLDEEPTETQAQIADALGYDRSHLVGVLDDLEERGLIERRRDTQDRRRHLVTHDAGRRKALTRLRAIVSQVEEEYFEPLNATERKTLTSLLGRLAGHHDPRYRSSELARRAKHRLDQPGEAPVELVPPELEELPPAVLALLDHARAEQRLEVVARGRLLHRDADLPALDLACLVALLGELAHDLEAHRIGERLEHGDAADGIEIGSCCVHCLTSIEQNLYGSVLVEQ